ncbi:MAG: HAD family phosphatase [Nitrospirae bacterium]|nr:HAD family phosphatase [Nitrospirota bacterium]
MIRVLFLDFGGVIADEGFYEGLKAVAARRGLQPEGFFRTAEEIIHEIGYVTGRTTEAEFWNAVRQRTGIRDDNAYLREQILSRFILRPEVLALADSLRLSGIRVCILSDQTDWLDELDRRTPYYHHFDRVFNSFVMHKSKRDASLFSDVCTEMGIEPGEALFVDDNIGNVARASDSGLKTIHVRGRLAPDMVRSFLRNLEKTESVIQ